jgi:hypothetical protein
MHKLPKEYYSLAQAYNPQQFEIKTGCLHLDLCAGLPAIIEESSTSTLMQAHGSTTDEEDTT